jgi:membrane protein
MGARLAAMAGRWRGTRAGRTLARYGRENGALLAGGLAYSALFSLFAALTVAFSVFWSALSRFPKWRSAVVATVDEWLPGAVDAGHGGLAAPSALIDSGLLTWSGSVAGVVLLVSASAFTGSLRAALRAMFGLREAPDGALAGRALALLGGLALGAVLLVSSALSIATTMASGWAARVSGLGISAWLALALGQGGAWAVETVGIAVLFRVLAGARPGRRDLFLGAGGAALAIGVLRHGGARVVAHMASNPLLASVATVAVLLAWVNLLARIVLCAAAWTASGPDRAGGGPVPVPPGPAGIYWNGSDIAGP